MANPEPAYVREGRPFLYDATLTSSNGTTACAACHIFGDTDHLAWDLGNPDEEVVSNPLVFATTGLPNPAATFHPMKGPMTTQTLQDIIGKEPLHWRGDRDGLEEFNGAFEGLQGDDRQLTDEEMQRFEDFLATLHFPPNPFRNRDNTLPTDLPLPDQFSNGLFEGQGGLEPGDPMPNGDATRGLTLYRPPTVTTLGNLACSSCHSMPVGASADMELNDAQDQFVPIPPGPNGEHHLSLVINDGTTDSTMKVPQLRNLYEKRGFDTTHPESVVGFGYEHDGSMDSLTSFLMRLPFVLDNDQQISDLVAFLLAFSGSDLPEGSTDFTPGQLFEPPGPPSQDAHAAVGVQLTVTVANRDQPQIIQEIDELAALADTGAVALVAKAVRGGEARGYAYTGAGALQSDRSLEITTLGALRTETRTGEEVTLTVVSAGSETRIGIDRDQDGAFDRDEIDACSDPADPASTPETASCPIFEDGFESGDTSGWSVVVSDLS